jgi:WD40 repeat protein
LFAASDTLLVADPGPSPPRFLSYHWLGRDGSVKPATADSAFDSMPRLAADGRRLAVSIAERNGRSGIWTIDLVSGARTRVTLGDTSRWSPAWSAGAAALFYLGDNGLGGMQLLSKTIAGGNETVVSARLPRTGALNDCSSDYCLISAWRPETGTNYDVLAVRLSDGAVTPAAATAADEDFGRLSPDGKLLAYTLEQNGEKNVFVRSFPSDGGVWQASTGGGQRPAWSRDGRQLYYLTDKNLVSVDVTTNGGFSAGPPRDLVSRRPAGSTGMRIEYFEMLADGRILAAMSRGSDPAVPYRLVVNWNR